MTSLATDSNGGNKGISPEPLLVLTTSYSGANGTNTLRAPEPLNTGQLEYKNNPQKSPEYDYSDALIGKYVLQSVSREMHQSKPGKPDRICSCLRMNAPGRNETLVKKSQEFKKCHYGNLVVCGSVWKCPICNPKISEQRAKEIRHVIDSHIESGGKVALLTFTIPHTRQDHLPGLLKSLQSAFDRTWISESSKRLKVNIGMEGYVRAKEVTYSYQNAFHPHFHQLVLYRNDAPESETLELIKNTLFPVYKNRCEKVGLGSPSYEHGLDVRGGQSAAEYLTKFGKEQKWGLDKELTKGNSKKSQDENRYTPFDFLREYYATKNPDMTRLFLEYADAFHGSQFVTWSRGLKERYGIDDSAKQDQEIAKSIDEISIVIGRINLDEWKKILHHNKRAEILILANQSWEDTVNYIKSLSRKYQRKIQKQENKKKEFRNVGTKKSKNDILYTPQSSPG